jgi:hypothetical protein
VPANTALTAETQRGDIVVAPTTLSSALLASGDGELHAKFTIDGVHFGVDTKRRANVRVEVMPAVDGSITVKVKVGLLLFGCCVVYRTMCQLVRR